MRDWARISAHAAVCDVSCWSKADHLTACVPVRLQMAQHDVLLDGHVPPLNATQKQRAYVDSANYEIQHRKLMVTNVKSCVSTVAREMVTHSICGLC